MDQSASRLESVHFQCQILKLVSQVSWSLWLLVKPLLHYWDVQQVKSLVCFINTENIQLFHVTDSGGYQAGNSVDRATGELPNELKDAQYFLDSYKDVFNGELGCLAGAERLEVNPEVVPVKMPLRKVPISVQNRLEEEIRRLETLGVIEKITEPTDWVSGLVVAEKKNGKLRICIDPKPLNKALRRRTYPMPTMEDVLPRLNKAKVFTVCDVKNGFWHVQLEEQSSVLTTFATPYGRYKWNRLPFGVAPAPELFQQKMDECILTYPVLQESWTIFLSGEKERL